MPNNFNLSEIVPFRSAAVQNTAVAVKSTPGYIFKIIAQNYDAALRYIQVYNDVAANITVGTTVPTKTIPLPASGAVIDDTVYGQWCSKGISIAVTVNNDGSGAAPTAALVCIDYNT